MTPLLLCPKHAGKQPTEGSVVNSRDTTESEDEVYDPFGEGRYSTLWSSHKRYETLQEGEYDMGQRLQFFIEEASVLLLYGPTGDPV